MNHRELDVFRIGWLDITDFLRRSQFEKGFDPAVATYLFAGIVLAEIPANLYEGKLGDWFGHSSVATVVAVCASGELLMATMLWVCLGVMTGIVVTAAGLPTFGHRLHTHTIQHLTDVDRGGDVGAVYTIYISVGGVEPAYTGVVAGQISHETAHSRFRLYLLGVTPSSSVGIG